ncbi:hypothetical protein MGYG_05191 [Nannizzia gypsea CBS 118893]|uniref:Uncharacterized protein n=1 Tax=Arthroderma gypseum (strain ATCC MYA-4604 / CBS 118893) TaxID=535722 RepID=E4UV61_ARTGP|nr:hypothetical protein MGYG_05191 [Nannizzia gypsea CBS 118893]EFR02188.1 hypothetical protein MGYG_05191 [Nannizzia gypsea CBS 118893]
MKLVEEEEEEKEEKKGKGRGRGRIYDNPKVGEEVRSYDEGQKTQQVKKRQASRGRIFGCKTLPRAAGVRSSYYIRGPGRGRREGIYIKLPSRWSRTQKKKRRRSNKLLANWIFKGLA